MAANQTQRPKFFEEQYLGAADLTAVVDYGRIQQARHRKKPVVSMVTVDAVAHQD